MNMDAAKPHQVDEYITVEGRSPFSEWLNDLKDRKARARIRVRIDRLSLGNFGDCRSLGANLYELCIDHGPGYRVYFGHLGSRVVLLLSGGSKNTQQRDINQAREFWADFKKRAS